MKIEVKTASPRAVDTGDVADHGDSRSGPRPSAEPVAEATLDGVAVLRQELGEMRDRWMRSEAEMSNLRARGKRDVDEARQFAIQKFATDVVEMAETLNRGVASLPAPRDGEPEILTRMRDGFSGVEQGFVGLLARNGISRHDPTGESFDPDRHQAMDQKPSIDHAPGTVLQAWTSAWMLNGRLLRPAMVVVATSTPPAPNPSH